MEHIINHSTNIFKKQDYDFIRKILYFNLNEITNLNLYLQQKTNNGTIRIFEL